MTDSTAAQLLGPIAESFQGFGFKMAGLLVGSALCGYAATRPFRDHSADVRRLAFGLTSFLVFTAGAWLLVVFH